MVKIDYEACVGCGLCAEICPRGAISVTFGKASVNALACTGCGQCIEVCRAGAIRWRDEKTGPKIPARPGVSRGRFGSYRFPSRQQTAVGRTYDHESLSELKERLRDMKKKAEGILKRIERL